MRPGWIAAGLLSAAVLSLTLLLPARAPFSGDNGLRLWAASSGPGHLDRAMPQDMDASGYRPSLTVPDGSNLLPAYGRTLPTLVSLGGLIQWPVMWRLLVAVASLLALPLLSRLSGLGSSGGALCFLAAGLVPYSLLFWEHGPAVTLFLLTVVLLLRSLGRASGVPWWLVAAAAACRLRPEMIPALAALLVVLILRNREAPGAGRTFRWAAAASLLSVLGIVLFPECVLGQQVLNNMPGTPSEILSSRKDVLQAWTLPGLPVMSVSVLLWGGATVFLLLRKRGRRLRRTVLAGGLAGAVVMLYPVARGSAGTMSLLTMAPAAVLLPAAAYWARGPGRTLLLAGISGGLLVGLLSPTHGMFQFGPRFLLGPSVLSAAGALRTMKNHGFRRYRGMLPAAVLVLGLLGTVRGVLFCGYFRARHMDLQRSLENTHAAVLCTDEEWLPLVCWPQAQRVSILVMEPDRAESLAASGMELVWLSSRSVLGGKSGEPGFRHMRYSLPYVSEMRLPEPPAGPLEPYPPLLAI